MSIVNAALSIREENCDVPFHPDIIPPGLPGFRGLANRVFIYQRLTDQDAISAYTFT